MGKMRALRAFTIAVLGLGLIAAACGGGGSSESPAQAKVKITAAWEKFFDPAVPPEQKQDIVQDFNALLPTLKTQTTNPQASAIKAKVSDITLNGDKAATVRYDIVNSKDGTPLLPNASGQAIKEGDNWKVSEQTFCQLVKLSDQNAKCP
jgi:ABC-type glycerol-3-phosphate transport system substrate-binding protein